MPKPEPLSIDDVLKLFRAAEDNGDSVLVLAFGREESTDGQQSRIVVGFVHNCDEQMDLEEALAITLQRVHSGEHNVARDTVGRPH